jgi:hypothetical protein
MKRETAGRPRTGRSRRLRLASRTKSGGATRAAVREKSTEPLLRIAARRATWTLVLARSGDLLEGWTVDG